MSRLGIWAAQSAAVPIGLWHGKSSFFLLPSFFLFGHDATHAQMRKGGEFGHFLMRRKDPKSEKMSVK
jgi:hypothetical protein